MKFTDGAWLMREGVTANYAAEAYELDCLDDALAVLAPTRPIRHRGDTLQGPVLTLRYSSPMADVIRVQVSHYTGSRSKPRLFDIAEEPGFQPSVLANSEEGVLTSGRLSVHIERKSWNVRFTVDGRPVTRSPFRGLAYAQVEGENAGSYIHEQLNLGVGECVYGLGERFTSFVKNGQVVESWNKDGGTGSEQAYKNVPFYLTNRGYGVFVNDPGEVSFEVASEKVSRVQFSVPGESLEYFVIYGPTPKEILAKYTALTGKPALPPAWSFGLWLTTSFTTNYDEATVTDILKGMSDRKLPLHVFHFDCFWMREFRWCDFKWDPRTFPDPTAMLSRLHGLGMKISVWINSYIAQRSELFAEGVDGGYLIKRPNGEVFQTDQWQPGMGIVDFTNPAACQWFGDKLRALVDQGVDCIKTDFGERIPLDVAYHDGSEPERMHNYYTFLYNKCVFDVLREKRGEGEAVLFARSGTAGSQQFPVHWGGDCNSNFESMAESLRGGLSLGLSGFGFWSHDIGGFEGTPPIEVYKRWIAFGLLSSHSRLHGNSSYRVPWLFDEESVDVLRFFTNLKCRLMPYLFGSAVEANAVGIPMMRAMLLEFPDDPACDYLDRQYMLGGSLLVAPIFRADGIAEYYVPEGRWTSFLTGEVIAGPLWVRGGAPHGYLSVPLLVRPNSVIAVGKNFERPDYDFADGVTLQVYEPADGCDITVTVPDQRGGVAFTAHVRRAGQRLSISADGGATAPWQVLLVGASSAEAEGSDAQSSERGVLITPQAGVREIGVTLPG